jgi:hypothetical protein
MNISNNLKLNKKFEKSISVELINSYEKIKQIIIKIVFNLLLIKKQLYLNLKSIL